MTTKSMKLIFKMQNMKAELSIDGELRKKQRKRQSSTIRYV